MARAIDQIQARYGWADDVVFGLTFTRFIEICRTISQARQDEAREKMTLDAFLGWQMGQFWGYKDGYTKYLQELGLLENAEVGPAIKEQKKNMALSRAACIVKADKRRG